MSAFKSRERNKLEQSQAKLMKKNPPRTKMKKKVKTKMEKRISGLLERVQKKEK